MQTSHHGQQLEDSVLSVHISQLTDVVVDHAIIVTVLIKRRGSRESRYIMNPRTPDDSSLIIYHSY